MGRGATKRGWRAHEVLLLQKKGGGECVDKVLAMLKGGINKLWVVFMR